MLVHGKKSEFEIMSRDGFSCLYCGRHDGINNLKVILLIHESFGGRAVDENQVTACFTCATTKDKKFILPPSFYIGNEDADGFRMWKKFGTWSVMVTTEIMVLELAENHGYWLDFTDVLNDAYCARHISMKDWPLDWKEDFLHAYLWLTSMAEPVKSR